MPLSVRCEKCGKRLQAPDAAAGKRVKCPGCGAAISVPAVPAKAASAKVASVAAQPAGDLLSELEDDDLFSAGPLANLAKASAAAGASFPVSAGGPLHASDPLGPTPVRSKRTSVPPAVLIGGSVGAVALIGLLILASFLFSGGSSAPDDSTDALAQAIPTAGQGVPAQNDATASDAEPSDLFDLSLLPGATAEPLPGAEPEPAASAALAPATVQGAAPEAAGAAPAQPAAAGQPAATAAPIGQIALASPSAETVKYDNQRRQAQITNMRDRYRQLLGGDPADLLQQVRYMAASKRPTIGLRWGVSLPMPQPAKKGPAKERRVITSEEGIVQATGTAGKVLLAGLNERISRGDFGDYGSDPSRQIEVLPGDERGEILAAARERDVDCVIMLKFEYQMVRQHRKKKAHPQHHQQHHMQGGPMMLPPVIMPPRVPPVMVATLSARMLDVPTGTAGWTSDILSGKARADAEQDAKEWANDILGQIDNTYKLQPVPELEQEQVVKRVTELQKKKPVNALPVLFEVRYYQLKELIPQSRAREVFAEILGDEGNLLASNDREERERALKKMALP